MTSTTITSGANNIVPIAVYGYETTQQARNLEHPIIGTANTDITYRPASKRRGTLQMVFATEAAADSARTLLATTTAPWTLTNSVRTTVNMTFAVSGDIKLGIDRTGAYLLDVGYVEP